MSGYFRPIACILPRVFRRWAVNRCRAAKTSLRRDIPSVVARGERPAAHPEAGTARAAAERQGSRLRPLPELAWRLDYDRYLHAATEPSRPRRTRQSNARDIEHNAEAEGRT